MKNTENRPKIGMGIMILRDGKVLLGQRKNSHGAGEYAFPGGQLEYMESFEECAMREIEEETGLKVKNIRFQVLGNLRAYNPLHVIFIGMAADWESGEAELKEPEKCDGWDWYDLDNLPTPLFKSVNLSLEAYRSGKNYLDAP